MSSGQHSHSCIKHEQSSIIISWQGSSFPPNASVSFSQPTPDQPLQISTPASLDGGRCFVTQIYFREMSPNYPEDPNKEDEVKKNSHVFGTGEYEALGGLGTLSELPADYYRGYCDSDLKICGGRMVEFNVKLPNCPVSDWQHSCDCDKKNWNGTRQMACWDKNAWTPYGCGGQNERSNHGNPPYGYPYTGQKKWSP